MIHIIIPIKNRILEYGTIVEVYRNLHTPNSELFSIRDKKSGLVLSHGSNFVAKNVKCKVRENGRQTVIKNRRKLVHAFLICNFKEEQELNIDGLDELYYNPYLTPTFINKTTGEEIHNAETIYFAKGRVYLIN